MNIHIRHVHHGGRNQRGVAIVLAMGIVALSAVAATSIMVAQSTWVRHSELSSDRAQAQLIAKAGVDWSRAVLSDDRLTSNVDHLGEPWALRLPPLHIENGKLAGYLEDQHGRYNLNNLVRNGEVNLAQLAHFRRLLTVLGLPSSLASTLVDWLDADTRLIARDGAEDAEYLDSATPYLAANLPLSDVAELALIRGYDEDVRARLQPYVTALPRFTPVNVNTAPPEVLAAIVDGLSLSAARELLIQRDRAYVRDRAEFRRRLPRDAQVADDDVTVSSDYFVAYVRASIGDAEASSVALLARQARGWPDIIWRKSS